MDTLREHHRHVEMNYEAHRMTYDRIFAYAVVFILIGIGATMLRYVFSAICTFIRNSPMPMW